MFKLARQLKAAGVLGINARNAEYLLPHNKRRFYPLVDDKLETKKLAEAAGIAVPTLYGVIHSAAEVRHLPAIIENHDDFVVKPARGSGGEGIVVVTGRTGTYFRLANGSLITADELSYMVQNIVSGIYSLGGQPDKALIEYRVRFDTVFEAIAYQGVPDVRIISFFGFPVMAMVRLPTRLSGGKANLHQGAIGAGIDIATGRTLTAVWRNSIVESHPDTSNPVSDITIPQWDTLLDLAARAFELTKLSYQGIDIVLDAERGPLILELNARPGLNIQIANRAGLTPRLERVLEARGGGLTPEARVAFAKKHFAAAR